MPPASLPAIPAINPGPITARNASSPRRPRNRPRSRTRRPISRGSRKRGGAMGGGKGASAVLAARAAPDRAPAEPAVLVDDRNGEQVVARHDRRDIIAIGPDLDRD